MQMFGGVSVAAAKNQGKKNPKRSLLSLIGPRALASALTLAFRLRVLEAEAAQRPTVVCLLARPPPPPP